MFEGIQTFINGLLQPETIIILILDFIVISIVISIIASIFSLIVGVLATIFHSVCIAFSFLILIADYATRPFRMLFKKLFKTEKKEEEVLEKEPILKYVGTFYSPELSAMLDAKEAELKREKEMNEISLEPQTICDKTEK